jgi:outer membrane protein assembly factor BamB
VLLRASLRRIALVAIPLLLTTSCSYSWLQWGGSSTHSGFNRAEGKISAANVNTLQRVWDATLPTDPYLAADGAPLYMQNVKTATGTRDLLYVETMSGDLVALDAKTGNLVWNTFFSSSTCSINNTGGPCYTTSTPAIDYGGAYIYAYGLDGKVHKVAVGTGIEVTDAHWPEVATLKGFDEKGSSALTIAVTPQGKQYLYVTNSGYPGDRGDYQGHVTVIDLASGVQRVFNTLCSDQTVHFADLTAPDCPEQQSGVWARGGVTYDTANNRVYLATGNATFSPVDHDWGDTVIALNPDGTGNANGDPIDSYTPTDFDLLNTADRDLGSTGPAILPVTDTRVVKNLAVQGGKDQMLRLLNLDDLSGQGGPGFTGGELGAPIPVPQQGQVLSSPTVWTNPADGSTWVFVCNYVGSSALQVVYDSAGNPSLQLKWKTTNTGTTATIANGVLYAADDNHLAAYNPTTGAQLWSDTTIGAIHWQSPVVDNGMLFLENGGGHVFAYALPST